jgi:hypothetical protein
MESTVSENQAIGAAARATAQPVGEGAYTSIAEQQRLLPASYCELRWYAAYTSANHEKRVAEQLGVRGVSHFLPLYASLRQWKDRRVTLQLPLFPGYVFVRMALRDRLQVQQVPGVAKLVGFNGLPTAMPDDEIELLRASLEDRTACACYDGTHGRIARDFETQEGSGAAGGFRGIDSASDVRGN